MIKNNDYQVPGTSTNILKTEACLSGLPGTVPVYYQLAIVVDAGVRVRDAGNGGACSGDSRLLQQRQTVFSTGVLASQLLLATVPATSS